MRLHLHKKNGYLFILLLLLMPATVSAKGKKTEKDKKDEETTGLKAGDFKGLKLRSIGPALMSGRIADIAVHPHDQSTWYVAAGSGGVWKTENAATTWKPIFDKQKSYSIGCLAIDPNRPEVIWVGTGENVGGRHVGFGDGIYRSPDGGSSWENMGLKSSQHIGRILIDPRDSKVIYVAAQGPLWSAGGERGLFKSKDGGTTWEKILGGGDYTGVNDVVLDPRKPDLLYAATHQRFRNVAALIDGGPESGIHKSEDGGQTWQELKNGLPKGAMGKIGLAVSLQNPDVVYATIELAEGKGGFYRSQDRGGSWEKRDDYLSGGTGPHYYQEIFASPHQFDRIYQMDARLHVSHDGGTSFAPVGELHKHGDNHAMAFDPNDPEYLLVGSDGGLYESWDLGKTWKYVANLPITQFYKVAVDYDEPFYNLYGGTQDNNTQGGPSRTQNTSGILNSDWFITLFADGHQPAVDPTNPDIVYSEWQQGNLVRYDRKTGELIHIQPQPEKGENSERFNWDAPILISPHDPARLYYASQRVWRSDDRGDSWRAISGDLSYGKDRLLQPMMGKVWGFDAVWDVRAMSKYGTITSLAESPLVDGLLYAGTDDGLIQVSEDGGGTWRKIEVGALPGLPPGSFINDLKADLHHADTVYGSFDNHKAGDFNPYVYQSTDRGRSWTSMAGDLPERHLVWRLVQDHVQPELFFAATEFGIFFSLDAGKQWLKLTGDVPTISFRDLAIQKRENDLVAASFGRGFYILDDYSPLRHVSEQKMEKESLLFPVKDAWWYIQKRPLGRGDKATQGSGFFTAPNPPFGAVFTYYLPEDLLTEKERRKKERKKRIEEGADTPYPGWETLAREEREDKPAMILTVRTKSGRVVRRLSGPAKAGFHRVSWDLRYPSLQAWSSSGGDNPFGEQGWLATPGDYSVSMAKRLEGKLTPLSESRDFTVKPLAQPTLPGIKPAELDRFLRDLEELGRVYSAAGEVAKTTENRLGAMKEVLSRSTIEDPDLYAEIHHLENHVKDLTEALQGNRMQGRMGVASQPSIGQRFFAVAIGNMLSTYGPTPTHRRSYELAREALVQVSDQLNRLNSETIPALEGRLEQAGVPWSPGRAVPGLD